MNKKAPKNQRRPSKAPHYEAFCLVFFIFAPFKHQKLEAGGIEPPSRDNVNDGLYMFIRCFNLDTDGEHRHPSPASSRLNFALRPTAESESQPALFSLSAAGI
jgi:hypothetical protein